jgi:hypothetical protein
MPWTLKHSQDPNTGLPTQKTKFDSLKDLIQFGMNEMTQSPSTPAISDWLPHCLTPRPTLKSLISAKPDSFDLDSWKEEAKEIFLTMKYG